MRHRKWLNLQIADRQRTMTVNDTQIEFAIGLSTPDPGTVRHPNRQPELAGQPKYPCNMVAMLMGNQNSGQMGWCPAKAQQTGHGFP